MTIALQWINLTLGGIRTRDLLFCRRTRWPLCHAAKAVGSFCYKSTKRTGKNFYTFWDDDEDEEVAVSSGSGSGSRNGRPRKAKPKVVVEPEYECEPRSESYRTPDPKQCDKWADHLACRPILFIIYFIIILKILFLLYFIIIYYIFLLYFMIYFWANAFISLFQHSNIAH
jgi:hypothetical protein